MSYPYHYIVKITTAPTGTGSTFNFDSIHSGLSGWAKWDDTNYMTKWLPGGSLPSVSDTIGITLTSGHASTLGWDPNGDPKIPATLASPGYHPLALQVGAVHLEVRSLQTGAVHALLWRESGGHIRRLNFGAAWGQRGLIDFTDEGRAWVGEAAKGRWEVVAVRAELSVLEGATWHALGGCVVDGYVDPRSPLCPGAEGVFGVHPSAPFAAEAARVKLAALRASLGVAARQPGRAEATKAAFEALSAEPSVDSVVDVIECLLEPADAA